jgi:hypothetical protein
MGGGANVAAIMGALVAGLDRRGLDGLAAVPWFFPGVEDYRARLERRGFRVRTIGLIERPTPLPGAMAGWLETFAESFIRRLPTSDRTAYIAEVETALAPKLRNAEGQWHADYVRLRFTAEKP